MLESGNGVSSGVSLSLLIRSPFLKTYAWEFGAAITTFWRRSLLLDVEVSELAAWSSDHADFVGDGIVSVKIRWSADAA